MSYPSFDEAFNPHFYREKLDRQERTKFFIVLSMVIVLLVAILTLYVFLSLRGERSEMKKETKPEWSKPTHSACYKVNGYFREIGVAWESDSGTINIHLDSLPINFDGSFTLFRRKKDE